MKDIAINVENLSKMYKLYDKPIDRLKESVNPFGRKYYKKFYALDNINFSVYKGETVGIIGKNGSGKSTLLKIITGVLTQTAGNVRINGRVSALLELGAGFNPEYTGIENIYLNGTMMGYSRKDMDDRIESILSFADIGDFIYQPVKTYSSGMFARLAFSVAINVDPDILIVDEALSVGDAFFQNKCFHKFEEFKKQNKTILFVSHDIGSIKQLCSRVLWLDKGNVLGFGDKELICAEYLNHQMKDNNSNSISKQNNSNYLTYGNKNSDQAKYVIPKVKANIPSGGTGQVSLISFFIKNSKGEIVNELMVEEDYSFHFFVKFNDNVKDVLFGLYLENTKGVRVVGINNYMYKKVLEDARKEKIIEALFKLKIPRLQKGQYMISPAIASGTYREHIILCWYHNLTTISISNYGYNLSIIEPDALFEIYEHTKDSIIVNEDV